MKGESYYTEAELYFSKLGIECVVFGPGNPDLAHSIDEYVEVGALRKGVKLFQQIIERWCC